MNCSGSPFSRSSIRTTRLERKTHSAQALVKGETLGLVVRITTAQGKSRVIEVNAGARYGAGSGVSHLRCHVTDVTEKARAERALRHRTRELTRVNEQLQDDQP